MKLTPEMLVLIAPCVLLAGVVLQLLLARVLTPRGKGILAVLSCLPSLGAVLAIFPMVRDGAAIDFTALPWDGPLSVVLHVDALSAMFALMGTGLGLIVLLLLHRLHGEGPGRHALLRSHADVHLRHGRPGL